jgi:hypothetical protein
VEHQEYPQLGALDILLQHAEFNLAEAAQLGQDSYIV